MVHFARLVLGYLRETTIRFADEVPIRTRITNEVLELNSQRYIASRDQ